MGQTPKTKYIKGENTFEFSVRRHASTPHFIARIARQTHPRYSLHANTSQGCVTDHCAAFPRLLSSSCAPRPPQAPKIDITGVKPAVLLNVGLLTCALYNGSEQIVEIKIMTQVSKRKDGVLMRVMFNPLD